MGAAVFGGYLAEPNCEFCAFPALLIGLPILGAGVIQTAIGIPLWVSGAEKVPGSEARSSASDMPLPEAKRPSMSTRRPPSTRRPAQLSSAAA